jgi:hypothetical protein
MKLVHLHVTYSKLICTECYALHHKSLPGIVGSPLVIAFKHLCRCIHTSHIKI